MSKSVWENKLDMEQYIEKRILEISDLQQRKMLKETLKHLFYHLYEYIEEQYQNLEDKLLQDVKEEIRQFAVNTSIIPREAFDATEEALIPMVLEDGEEKEINTAEMLESLMLERPFFLYTVFLEADYLAILQMEKEERSFKGSIKTNIGDFKAKFILNKNEGYYALIEALYEFFYINHLPWTTVCAPYLNKLFDLYIYSIESWEAEAQIQEIVVDFMEYQPFIRYGYIPVWNVSSVIIKSSAYPEPVLDDIHYQHVIFRHKLEQETNYIVGMRDIELMEVKRMNQDLYITCKETFPVKWRLLKFGRGKLKNPRYPVFSNQIQADFMEALSMKYHRMIKTKTELMHYIISMGYEDIVCFSDMKLLKEPPGTRETYDLDYFIEDEFHTGNAREVMMVYFTAVHPGFFLNRDIMSYIITRVQKLFPEYDCIGELV